MRRSGAQVTGQGAQPPDRGKRIGRGLEVAAAAIFVAGAVFAGARTIFDSGADLFRTDSSQVEVRQVVLLNGRIKTAFADGRFLQLRQSTPQLDVTVRNTGKLPALLTGVRVSIEDSGRLAVCEYHTGDMTPTTGSYAITLPILPLPRERIVTHPLHQEVSAGSVDRFKLHFRLPWNSQDNYIYAIRVELISEDDSAPIDLGRFLIGLPESVNRGGRILPEGSDPFGVVYPGEQLMSTWCGRRNLAEIERMLSRPGKRSASMAALRDFQAAEWWQSFQDSRQPEEIVGPLMRMSRVGEGPVLAVFAAEQSGDPELIAEAKKRAADLLLDQVESNLSRGGSLLYWGAVLAARQALAFESSGRGERLLQRAEPAVEAIEAERQAEREEMEVLAGE